MVTDMHRLERAARMSMGDFDLPSPVPPPSRRPSFSPRFAVPLAALAVLAVAALLFG
jgi:hypothetical protein